MQQGLPGPVCKIEVFPQGQLYSIAQIVPALSQGQVDLGGVLDVLLLMQVDKNFYLTGMQRFFNSFEQKTEVLAERTPVGRKYWDADPEEAGHQGPLLHPGGPDLLLLLGPGPGRSLAAFKGLESPDPHRHGTLQLQGPMGVNFVKVSTAEVYSALKSGMIDTFNTVPSAVKAYGWWDFAKFAQQPYTFYADAYVAVNLKWWDSLPQDLQDLMEKEVGPQDLGRGHGRGHGLLRRQVLKDFAEASTAAPSPTWTAEELNKKALELDKTQVWPEIAKSIDPELYQAAQKWVGLD